MDFPVYSLCRDAKAMVGHHKPLDQAISQVLISKLILPCFDLHLFHGLVCLISYCLNDKSWEAETFSLQMHVQFLFEYFAKELFFILYVGDLKCLIVGEWIAIQYCYHPQRPTGDVIGYQATGKRGSKSGPCWLNLFWFVFLRLKNAPEVHYDNSISCRWSIVCAATHYSSHRVVALKQLLDSNAKFKVKEAEERQIRMELDLQQQQATAKISQLQMEGNAQVSLFVHCQSQCLILQMQLHYPFSAHLLSCYKFSRHSLPSHKFCLIMLTAVRF